MPAAAPDATSTQPIGEPTHWFRRLRKHPVFPLILFIIASICIRDNFPFSHYPMYSRPSAKPLPFQYVATADGEPLPIKHHTGVTPSRVGKMFGERKKRLWDAEQKLARKEKREPKTEAFFKEEAGRELLAYLRQLSQKRAKYRHLPEDITLRETTVGMVGGHYEETDNQISTLQSQ